MRKIIIVLLTVILVLGLSACSSSSIETISEVADAALSNTAIEETTTETTVSVPASASAVEALASNSSVHDEEDDYLWDTDSVVQVSLNGNSITTSGEGVVVVNSKVTITSAGTYSFNGTLEDGQIIVETDDEEVVRLILNSVDIHCSQSAPIFVNKAEKVVIVLGENTQNYVTDGTSYVFTTAEDDEPNAAIFSKTDMTIFGSGSLTVSANYNDGIASKDGLIIDSGTIIINAVDDGMRGKDYVVVKGGNITINTQGDGMKADNEEDVEKGFISIEAGTINITASGDAITAQTDVLITNGQFTLTAGSGNTMTLDETASHKGIKGTANVNIDGGTIIISASDDAIHSNGNIVINGGTFSINSGDDGMHADSTLTINGADIDITDSYEGIESAVITINNGNINLVSSDDGINVSGGVDSSGMMQGMGGGHSMGGGPGGGGPGMGGNQGTTSDQTTGNAFMPDAFSTSTSYYLYINGGTVVMNAGGDGIDVNGAIEMTNGIVVVNGPTENMNGALDYTNGFKMSGGFLVTAGSSGMAMAPDASSTQYSVLVNFSSMLSAGTLVHIQNSAGEDILTFSPTKEYQSITVSSPDLVNGTTYDIYTGGSSSGSNIGGLYQDGVYTPGTLYESFTISQVVTNIGMGNWGGGGGRP